MTFSKLQADADNINVVNSELEFGYGGLFSSECREGFADIETNESGIRIVVDNAKLEDDILFCQLLVTFCFERNFISGFNQIREAIIVLMENPSLRQSASFSLSDPHKIYTEYEGDNRIDNVVQNLRGSKQAYSEVFLEIPMATYTTNSQVYFRAVLEQHYSNVVEVTLNDKITIGSYLDGLLYTPSHVDLG